MPNFKNSPARNVLAVDLGGTKCSAAVVNRSGRILARRSLPVDLSSASAPVRQILHLVAELSEGKDVKNGFFGLGVAVPGLVRSDGTVWAPNLPGWKRMPLARRLTHSLKLPVVVESDRNASVLGECWRGAGQGKTDVIVVMIGTGIGTGILSGDRILRGAHELSGCAGWLMVNSNMVEESAAVGQLESLAAGPGIARTARKRMRDGESSILSRLDSRNITAHEVADAARKGDRLARDIFEHAGRFLGFGIANMISLVDPQLVILGGGMAAAADLYLDALRKAMLQRAQPLAARQVKIVVSKLGDTANLLGCARLAWEYAGHERVLQEQPARRRPKRTQRQV
jgi:glucokinase